MQFMLLEDFLKEAIFHPIRIPRPTDLIIRQIYDLLVEGVLEPGDRLPPENILAKQLGVRRNEVREALTKLEFMLIVKTIPQSGTYIAQDMGSLSLQTIFANLISYNENNIPSLLDTREILEIRAARLAATYINEREIAELASIHEKFVEQIEKGERGIDEDYTFHFKIAAFSHSPFLMHFLTMLLPEYMRLCNLTNRIEDGRYNTVVEEHTKIFNAIKNRNPEQAASSMMEHMTRIKGNRLRETQEKGL